MRIVAALCGLAALIGGVLQLKHGFRELKGIPEVGRLSRESDDAFDEGNQLIMEAGPLFQALLDSVDKDGVAAVRAGKKGEAEKTAALYGQAANLLRGAAQRAMDAAALKPAGNAVAFLETKAGAYRNFAAAREMNRDIALMILDDTIKTNRELVPKVLKAAERRDKLEASANEASSRADQLVMESKK